MERRSQLIMLLAPLLILVHLVPHLASCLPAAPSVRSGPQHPLSRKDARIGIVGAGPSGLHMAYLLRSLNFTNILVLDAAARVGGRSVSIADDQQLGVTHELGTCYLSSEYLDFDRMARGIGYAPETVPLPKAVVRTTDGGQQELDRFILDRVRRLDTGLPPDATDTDVRQRVASAAWQYMKTRGEFFPADQPDYFEFPIPQPKPALMSRLNCTLHQFLESHDLIPLEPLFLLGMTAMGYGSANDTSALYGLMWMTPAYLSDLIGKRHAWGERNATGLKLLRRGFQTFWNATRYHLERQGGVEFRLNSRVTKVARSEASVRLEWSGNPLDDKQTETLDWLVWTPSVLWTLTDTFDSLTQAEAAAFSGLTARKFRTKLVRLSGVQEPPIAANPVAYYEDALDGKPSMSRLLAVRNSAKVLLAAKSHDAALDLMLSFPPLNSPPLNSPPLYAPPLKMASLNDPPLPTYTLVTYYLSDYGDTSSDADKPSPSHLHLDGGEVLKSVTFDYMPRFSVADMAAGALWRLLENVNGARGSNRTWFAGHSMVFDSVKSIMKYNKMLLYKAFPELAEQLVEI